MADFEFVEELKKQFQLKEVDASQYAPLTLAYIGDTVYECINRTIAVTACDRQVDKLHRECSGRANAGTQAKIADFLEEEFSQEEMRIYHRGRNANIYTKAKNMTMAEYHKATGLEALVGYLYLTGRYDRLMELLKKGFTHIEEQKNAGK